MYAYKLFQFWMRTYHGRLNAFLKTNLPEMEPYIILCDASALKCTMQWTNGATSCMSPFKMEYFALHIAIMYQYNVWLLACCNHMPVRTLHTAIMCASCMQLLCAGTFAYYNHVLVCVIVCRLHAIMYWYGCIFMVAHASSASCLGCIAS